MRLRYGIPFTLALLLASSWLSQPDGFNTYYLLIGITAVWIAYDSRRLNVQAYATQLALPPIALAVATAIVWPLMFPLYLRTRGRITRGRIPEGELRQRVWAWLFGLTAIVLALGGMAAWFTRDVGRELLPLAQGIAAEFSTGVTLSIQDGWRAVVTLPAAEASDSAREELAFRVAQYTHSNHVPELTSVRVRFVDVRKRGAVTITRETGAYQWSYADLRRAEQASDQEEGSNSSGVTAIDEPGARP